MMTSCFWETRSMGEVFAHLVEKYRVLPLYDPERARLARIIKNLDAEAAWRVGKSRLRATLRLPD
jgi:hypothetical protein